VEDDGHLSKRRSIYRNLWTQPDLLGEAEARRVIASHPYYTALYALILRDSVAIRALFARYAYGP